MTPPTKSDLRIQVERLLDLHPSGLSCSDLAARTKSDLDTLRRCIQRMLKANDIRAEKPGSKTGRYIKRDTMPTIAQPNTVSKMADFYVPQPWQHELARPSSADHEKYGSRMGNRIVYRDGRVEPV